jgi:hypothetical protein
MADALREAYGDLFTIKAKPTDVDRPLIEGKFKSTHNVSPNVAKLMASTFYALLDLADLDSKVTPAEAEEGLLELVENPVKQQQEDRPPAAREVATLHSRASQQEGKPTLHYNIQIHLPASKDVEVFNAIFKSLKEHLLD